MLSDFNSIKEDKENLLLRKRLVQELTDKNKLLAEKNLMLQNNLISKDVQKPSYAEIINKKTSLANYTRLVIKPSDQDKKGTLELVKKELTKSVRIPVNSVKESKSGDIIISCNKNISEINVVKQNLSEKMGQKTTIVIDENKNPKIKIVGINNNMNEQELLEDIKCRNVSIKDNFKLIHKFVNKNTTHTSLILEVSTNDYSKIMESGTIYVGYQRCKVFDDFNVNKCWKCCGFGHSGNKCINEYACKYCAESHDSRDCKSEANTSKKCINCIRFNKYIKDKKT